MTFLHPSWTLPKKCPYSELLWSVFSRIWTEYGEICFQSEFGKIRSRMTQNTDTFDAVEWWANNKLSYETKSGSSRPKIFFEKSILKTFPRFTGKHLAGYGCSFVENIFFWKNMFLTKFFNIICRKNVFVWKKSFILKIFFTEKKLYLQIKI